VDKWYNLFETTIVTNYNIVWIILLHNNNSNIYDIYNNYNMVVAAVDRFPAADHDESRIYRIIRKRISLLRWQ